MSNFGNGKKFADVLTVLLIIVIIAILCLLGYFGYRIINKKSINDKNASKVDEFYENTPTLSKGDKEEIDEGDGSSDSDSLIDTSNIQQSDTTSSRKSAKKTYLDGFEIKGVMKISKINLELPILEKVTTDSLSKSIAILDVQTVSEAVSNTNDLNVLGTNALILGHNYRNGLFFSNNYKLTDGDKIEITDQLGEKVTYTIYSMYYTTPNDISFMERTLDPNSREITLQTCNDNSTQRLIIQAKDN